MDFDFPTLKLVKAYIFGITIFDTVCHHICRDCVRLEIPEERLESDDFLLGLSHELTERTLMELVDSFLGDGNYDTLVTLIKIHEVTILSLEKYLRISGEWDALEEHFKWKVIQK